MTFPYLDRVIFQAVSAGNGDFVEDSAVTGYQTVELAGGVNAQPLHYAAQSSDLSEWEVGEGTWTSGTKTLSRTVVLFNNNGNTTKVNFTAAPQVLITALAEDLSQLASSTQFGLVKVDGSTITASSGVISAPSGAGSTIVRLSSQFDKTSDNTLADVMSINVVSGNSYKFKFSLFVLRGTNGGSQFALSGSCSFSSLESWAYQAVNQNSPTSIEITAFNSAVFGATASGRLNMWVEGTIVITGNGTLTIQFAQNASGNNTSSVLVGSFSEIQQIV